MRTSRNRSALLLAGAFICLSLSGCSGKLFDEPIGWSGDFFSSPHGAEKPPRTWMHLYVRTDGTGTAENLPKGRQKWSTNSCIDVDPVAVERYTGKITWRKLTSYQFEIEFKDSRYIITAAPGKFQPDWTEARIHTCNLGPEYWAMSNNRWRR